MDRKRPGKADLLKELEAIHDSLLNSDRNANIPILMQEFREEVTDNDFELRTDEGLTLQNDTLLEESVAEKPEQTLAPITALPGQQSLFNETQGHDNDVEITLDEHAENEQDSVIYTENPFLPASIREKLNQHRTMLVDDLNRVGETLSKSSGEFKPANGVPEQQAEQEPSVQPNLEVKRPHNLPQNQPQNPTEVEADPATEQVVYKLVKKYLPIIEAELRSELRKMVELETAKKR